MPPRIPFCAFNYFHNFSPFLKTILNLFTKYTAHHNKMFEKSKLMKNILQSSVKSECSVIQTK